MKTLGFTKIAAAVVLLVGFVAWAASNPLLISATVTGGALSIWTTDSMPKGWFNSRNTFDRTKTDLRATYTIGATACSPETSKALSSLTVGEFTAVLNSNNTNDIGYLWNTTVDVAAHAEHYTIHIHCDGSEHIHGCNISRPVTVTVQAFDKNGAPITYVDDSGVTQLVQVTVNAGAIAPVLDATITETHCGDSCGIGECVSACEQSCPKGKGYQPCANACQCECKIKKNAENPLCHRNHAEECAP